MNGGKYWKNRIPFLLANGIGMAALFIFLLANGNPWDVCLMIGAVWILALAGSLTAVYLFRKKRLDKLLDTGRQLEKSYLIGEVMAPPERAEEAVYYELLRLSGKSMLEEIEDIRREKEEYREYIEQWIHEVKTPITAAKLLCENQKGAPFRQTLGELEKIGRYTEQALYYARIGCAEKDYLVREVSLAGMVHRAVAENKYLLLENQAAVETENLDMLVYTDEKWIIFILNQLIANSVKYKRENLKLEFYAREEKGKVRLFIRDNGMGIHQEDLPRIFEKGFTGSNGREQQSSTGIGLYLCIRLCQKLGIEIHPEETEEGALFSLTFYINSYNSVRTS